MEFRLKHHGMPEVELKSRYICLTPTFVLYFEGIPFEILHVFQELLSFNHPHVMSQRLLVENFEKNVERILNSPLDEIVIQHLKYYPNLKIFHLQW